MCPSDRVSPSGTLPLRMPAVFARRAEFLLPARFRSAKDVTAAGLENTSPGTDVF